MSRVERLVQADVHAALPRLRRFARVLTGDREGADRLVVAAIASAWRIQDARPAEGDLSTWLFGLMHAAHRRKAHRRGFTVIRLPVASHADDDAVNRGGAGGAGAETGDAANRTLWNSVLRLPVEEREVLMLAAVERLSYPAIASLLDVPVASVMSTLARARERMCAMASAEADACFTQTDPGAGAPSGGCR
jgi:RNA polymerase sigma-70 factor (ECF subfamily)